MNMKKHLEKDQNFPKLVNFLGEIVESFLSPFLKCPKSSTLYMLFKCHKSMVISDGYLYFFSVYDKLFCRCAYLAELKMDFDHSKGWHWPVYRRPIKCSTISSVLPFACCFCQPRTQ
jgi:hypothetical protein